MNIWLLILLASLLTMGERLSFILLIGDGEMPKWALKALSYVPVTVLTALALPAIMLNDDAIMLSANPKIFAAIASIIVAWWKRDILLTISVGMVTFWILSMLGTL